MATSQIQNQVKNIGSIPDPLPVEIDSPIPLPISASSLPLPTGAATSTNQATEIAALASILAALSGILNVNISSPNPLPVSAISLPLPSGASTSTNQSTEISLLSNGLMYGKTTATLKSITVTNPSAGVPWTVSPPSGKIWKILMGSWSFVASGTVANRVPNCFADTGSNVLYNDLARTTVTAGQTVRINAFAGGQLSTDILTPSENIFLSLPPDLLIDSGDTLNGGTNNTQLTDQFSSINLKVIEYA